MERVQYILGTLEDEDIDWLVSVGQRQTVNAKEILIQSGEPTQAIYLILEGQFTISTETSQHQPIAYLTSGDIAGEMSFIDTSLPSATVKATEPSLVLAIPKPELTSKLHYDICFAARFYEAMAILLSVRLRSAIKQIEHPMPMAQDLDAKSYNLDMATRWELGTVRYDWLLRRLRHPVYQSS
jgi:CRP/FNR family cyclic AMP-dependent transcriptional regulator